MEYTAHVPGVHFQDAFVGSFGLQCHFSAHTATNISEFGLTHDYITNIEQFANWDTAIEMEFYVDETFTTLAGDSNMLVGDDVFFRTIWHGSYGNNFKVRYYLDRCRMFDSGESGLYYDLIQGGCLSSLIGVERHSSGYMAEKELNYSYKSFSFDPAITTYDLHLVCDVNFCLQSAVDSGECGITKQCVDGYFTN